LALVASDCARASRDDELGSAAVVDGADEVDEVHEVEELDELDEPYKPGGKTSWLDGPRTSASALGFVVINGWGWFCFPAGLGGLAVVTGDKLGKFLSEYWRLWFGLMIAGNKLTGVSVKRTRLSVYSWSLQFYYRTLIRLFLGEKSFKADDLL